MHRGEAGVGSSQRDRPARKCGRCGRVATIAPRVATDGIRDLCNSCCRQEPVGVCGACGKRATIRCRCRCRGRDGDPTYARSATSKPRLARRDRRSTRASRMGMTRQRWRPSRTATGRASHRPRGASRVKLSVCAASRQPLACASRSPAAMRSLPASLTSNFGLSRLARLVSSTGSCLGRHSEKRTGIVGADLPSPAIDL